MTCPRLTVSLLVAANQRDKEFEDCVYEILESIVTGTDEQKSHVYSRIVEGISKDTRIADINRVVTNAMIEVGL